MKRKRHQPKKGDKILMVEYYVKHTNGSEDTDMVLYIWNKKHRRMWKVHGMEFKDETFSYMDRQSHRSVPALIAKWWTDWQSLSKFFPEFDMCIDEVGEL